jgi:hypothetical protein
MSTRRAALPLAIGAILAAPVADAQSRTSRAEYAPFPSCPPGFQTNVATSTSYSCTANVSAAQAERALQVADQTDCAYPGFWNVGPEIEVHPLMGRALIQWVCKHRGGTATAPSDADDAPAPAGPGGPDT